LEGKINYLGEKQKKLKKKQESLQKKECFLTQTFPDKVLMYAVLDRLGISIDKINQVQKKDVKKKIY